MLKMLSQKVFAPLQRNMKDILKTDGDGSVNSEVIEKVLKTICIEYPSLVSVLEGLESIMFICKKDTYDSIVNRIIEKERWGNLLIKNFQQIYPFEKPVGYSVRGLTFTKERIIIINLHQIVQCAEEYATYLSGDEQHQRRDYRYFARDCRYDNFKDYIRNKSEAVNFLFWNTLFEQLRSMEQAMQPVNLEMFGYKEERNQTLNDMIGFAKFMYEQFITDQKPIK